MVGQNIFLYLYCISILDSKAKSLTIKISIIRILIVLWDKLGPFKIHILKFYPQYLQNVTLFVDKIFTEVINLK